jgi:hypothetical protein
MVAEPSSTVADARCAVEPSSEAKMLRSSRMQWDILIKRLLTLSSSEIANNTSFSEDFR